MNIQVDFAENSKEIAAEFEESKAEFPLVLDHEKAWMQKGYEAGRKAEQTEFWEIYQMGGKRRRYRLFCEGTKDASGRYPVEQFWTDENYNPIYPIITNDGYCMFASNMSITDTKVPIVVQGTMDYAFGGAENIKTIRSLDLTDCTRWESVFYLCYGLENITFVGTVKVNLSFVYCQKLTHESLMSIINALYDFSSDTSGTVHTLKLGTDNLAKLTQAEKDIMTQKGWQYS